MFVAIPKRQLISSLLIKLHISLQRNTITQIRQKSSSLTREEINTSSLLMTL